MNKERTKVQFHSAVASSIEQFIEEKRALGYKYVAEADSLRRLDRFLCEQGLAEAELPKPLVQHWIAKDPNESLRTHRARIGLVRRFADFLIRQGRTAYVPDSRLGSETGSRVCPENLDPRGDAEAA